MCGLTGFLSFNPARWTVDERLLLAMRETMIHRGPDGAGLWRPNDGRVGLAHRRLAIVDLSDRATQPMVSTDGRHRIVFNGEIYNHRELRAELTARGHTNWRTDHSDTEVILAAFREWGIACLDKFRGMFAIALWDETSRELWLVRDRMGVKPLYYARDERGVVFASEIKAILADPTRPRALNEEAFFHFLSFLTTPAPMTMFGGIRKLAAGTWLRVRADGTVEERRWWDALDHVAAANNSPDEAAGQTLETLRRAVDYRKVSDVPVGVFLSGGIDSSLNLALFSEGETSPPRAFSIGFHDDQKSVADEISFAEMAAKRFGAEHHILRMTQKDLLDFLPRMVRLQDEPIADPVCVPVYYVSKLARDHGTIVCQVGEGADELFYGYPYWKWMRQLESMNRWPVPRLLKQGALFALNAASQENRQSTEALRRALAGQPVFWGGAEAFGETWKRKILSPRLREKFRDFSSWEAIAPIHARFKAKASEPSDLNWMTYLDLNLRLPELLLMRVDKMSMGASVEARVPFLDQDMVTLALGLPEQTKTRNGELKAVLKQAAGGILPDAILNRRKQGFAIPMRDWFLGPLGGEIKSTLDSFVRETDFLDPMEVGRILAGGHVPQAWYLYNFALWAKAYGVS